MTVSVRPATLSDIDAVARIHVLTWQNAYRNILPDNFLKNLSIESRITQWTNTLTYNQTHIDNALFVAVQNNDVCGFAACGPARDFSSLAESELYALYVLPDHQSAGVGRTLFTAAKDFLVTQGFKSAYSWSLEKNTAAHRAYEAWGGYRDGSPAKEIHIGDIRVGEIAHTWSLGQRD